MKGILALKHARQRYVYHSVHMLFNGAFEDPWAEGEAKESKMVFIGRNLDAKALAARFNACIANEENMAAKAKSYRFAIGDRVECRTGRTEWTPGTVVALNYRDDQMPQGLVAPYQIDLDNGRLIWAPKDDDCVIRIVCTDEEMGSSDDDDEAAEGHDHSSHMNHGLNPPEVD